MIAPYVANSAGKQQQQREMLTQQLYGSSLPQQASPKPSIYSAPGGTAGESAMLGPGLNTDTERSPLQRRQVPLSDIGGKLSNIALTNISIYIPLVIH